MKAKLTLDKRGRVVIPKKLRDELYVVPGDSFRLESSNDQILLRPVREKCRMVKKDGMWVLKTGVPITLKQTDAIIETIRRERDELNMGLIFLDQRP